MRGWNKSSLPIALLLTLVAILLTACQEDSAEQSSDMAEANEQTMPRESEARLIDVEFNQNLATYIETLSSDEFEGREPASAGEEKTIAFLQEKFIAAGAKPGNGDSFLQAVPLINITADESSPILFEQDGKRLELPIGESAITWTKRVTESVNVSASEVVFVGYGIVAPEYNWDDYANVDVHGKTVLILVNDPGFRSGDESLFNGRRMTYYGRWTYKFEEAARQGAAMALIIHETEAAGYGFDVVQGSWTGSQFDLVKADKNRDRVGIEGWLSNQASRDLMAASGQRLDDLAQAATRPGFQAQSLEWRASASLKNTLRESESNNVIAMIPGSLRPNEYFIYTAHWDHLGKNPSLDGDQIFNGAQDNATGTAALLALAEQFAAGPAPERSIVFAAVTAEESGLLGSRYLAENPPFPIHNIVAGVNMDALNIHGPMRDLIVVGLGNSELEPMVESLAKAQDRRIEPNPYPEKGFYYRSDHFNLAKKGVPMLYAKGGIDHFEKGESYGREGNQDYVSHRYHKPADEYGDWWDLRGMNQDLNLFLQLGQQVANSEVWPNWYPGNEFRSIRDESLKLRVYTE